MKIVTGFIILTIFTGSVSTQGFGLCAELCGLKCPEGYECRSNGCGHSCHKIPVKESTGCKPIDCGVFCVAGWQKDEHGCNICACAKEGPEIVYHGR